MTTITEQINDVLRIAGVQELYEEQLEESIGNNLRKSVVLLALILCGCKMADVDMAVRQLSGGRMYMPSFEEIKKEMTPDVYIPPFKEIKKEFIGNKVKIPSFEEIKKELTPNVYIPELSLETIFGGKLYIPSLEEILETTKIKKIFSSSNNNGQENQNNAEIPAYHLVTEIPEANCRLDIVAKEGNDYNITVQKGSETYCEDVPKELFEKFKKASEECIKTYIDVNKVQKEIQSQNQNN